MVEEVARREWARAVATIARATGDLQLAEDAVQDAFVTALKKWPVDGIPRNAAAWIVTVARNRALDILRRGRTHTRVIDQVSRLEALVHHDAHNEMDAIDDERLALIFTCCHPALAVDAQVALTLRLVAGLSTPEIARAFLISPQTMAQRLVRAQNKVRDAGIPIRTPSTSEMGDRLDAVLAVIYLAFNQGYSAPERMDLAEEAIRVGGTLCELLPDEPEVLGVQSLMVLQHSRAATRFDEAGAAVLLADQDRTQWDGDAITRGLELLGRAAALGRAGQYQLQAAIAACHARASTSTATDWRAIVALYGLLQRMHPSPVIALNRAAALSLAEGPEAALPAVDALAETLHDYHLFHATRADLLRRLGRRDESITAYERAFELAPTEVERAYLAGRIAELESS